VVDIVVATVGGRGVAQSGWRRRAALLLEAGEELQEGGKLGGGGEWIRVVASYLPGRGCVRRRERSRKGGRKGAKCAAPREGVCG
jgi:hypothetical protein